LNQRPLGYEPNELPDCSTPHQISYDSILEYTRRALRMQGSFRFSLPMISSCAPLDFGTYLPMHTGAAPLFFTQRPSPWRILWPPIDNFEDDLVRAYQPQVFAGELFYLIGVISQPGDLRPQTFVLPF
jgi:hypothetical protein